MSKLLKNMLTVYTSLRTGESEETASDVKMGDNGEVLGTGNDARVAMLNSIGDNSERERGDELADVNDDGSTSEFVAPAGEQEAKEEEKVEVSSETKEEKEPDLQKIFRKVNGQDVEITDDLIAKAQKVASADVYLAEAKRLREESLVNGQTHQESKNPEEIDLVATARALQMGTEEEAVAALQRLLPKTPSQDEISRKIDEQLAFKKAIASFNSDFKDITSDPVLNGLAQSMDNNMLAAGDKRSYEERYTEIGNTLRDWVASKGGKSESAGQNETKQERKASAPSAPKAATGKHVPVVEDEKEESTSDVIASMAAKRGGPQWMNGATQNR